MPRYQHLTDEELLHLIDTKQPSASVNLVALLAGRLRDALDMIELLQHPVAPVNVGTFKCRRDGKLLGATDWDALGEAEQAIARESLRTLTSDVSAAALAMLMNTDDDTPF